MIVVDETGYTQTFFFYTHGTEIHKLYYDNITVRARTHTRSVPGKR